MNTQITHNDLMKVKRRALRLKVWFKLEKLERSILELSLKCIKTIVKNKVLISILQKILNKINNHTFKAKARKIGYELALKQVKAAIQSGCKRAQEWLNDEGYITYLGVQYLNTPSAYQ